MEEGLLHPRGYRSSQGTFPNAGDVPNAGPPSGFDCSGLASYAYAQAGRHLRSALGAEPLGGALADFARTLLATRQITDAAGWGLRMRCVDLAGRVSTNPEPNGLEMKMAQKWEYLVVPLADAGRLKKKSVDLSPDRLNQLGSEGWEAVGLTLKKGDLIAWPVVLLKRPVD